MRIVPGKRARAAAAAAIVLVLGPLGPAIALAQEQQANPEDQVVLSGSVIVRRGQTVGEVIVVNGRVSVGGVVRGDVIVVSGEVDVSGQVAGDVVVFDGRVTLRASAFVGGDVVSRDDVQQAAGARIEGRIRSDFPVSLRGPALALGRFAVWVAVTVSTLLLGLLLILLAPRGTDAVYRAVQTRRWRSAWLGLLLAVGLPIVGAVLIVSLAGLPLGLGVLLALALVYWIGYAWSAWLLGRWLVGPGRNRALTFLAGWAILRAVAAIPFLGAVTWFLGAAYGLGAATIALWRARAPAAEPAPAWVGRTGTRAGVPSAASLGFEPAAAEAAPGEPALASVPASAAAGDEAVPPGETTGEGPSPEGGEEPSPEELEAEEVWRHED